MSGNRKKYTPELREQAVRLVVDLRRNITELLRAEVNPSTSTVTDITQNMEIALLYARNVDSAIGVACDRSSARN